MSNRDPANRDDSLPQVLRFAIDEALKNRVRVALPGVVLAYDRATRRADVQPGVDLMLTDGRTVERPVIVGVPVLWPAAGGFVFHMPLAQGDPVQLVFNHRDVSGFLATLERGPAATFRVMSDADAVAIPTFAPESAIVPAAAATIQTADGDTAIEIEPGRVTIRAAAIALEYQGGRVDYP